MKHVPLTISIVLLSGAIIFLAIQIGGTVNRSQAAPKQDQGDWQVSERGLMTESEAADYLHITAEELRMMINIDKQERYGRDSFHTYNYIPFITIGGQKFFNRAQLDLWIEKNITTWEEYELP